MLGSIRYVRVQGRSGDYEQVSEAWTLELEKVSRKLGMAPALVLEVALGAYVAAVASFEENFASDGQKW